MHIKNNYQFTHRFLHLEAITLFIFILMFALLPVTFIHAKEENTIRVTVPRVEEEGFNGTHIAQAVDEYVFSKLGFHVDLNFVVMDKYDREITHASLLGNLPDAFFIWTRAMSDDLIQKKQLTQLDDLLDEYGKDLISCLGEKLAMANAGYDAIYLLPNEHDREYANCFEYRASIADQYNLDMEHVHSLNDLSEVFARLHELAPDIVCCDSVALRSYDPLGDSLGVLMGCGKSEQVVNLYETEEFRDYANLISSWRKKGYLLDNNLGYDSVNRFVVSSEIFGKCSDYHPALTSIDSADAGEKICSVMLNEGFVTTDNYQYFQYGISSKSQYPEYAIEFLNLLFTDETLVNLLAYGLEGVHYQIINEELQTISFLGNTSDQKNGYHQFRGYYYGNEYLCKLWEGYPIDLWEQEKSYNDSLSRSYACGFVFDSSPVSDSKDACIQTVNSYLPLLNEGVGDTQMLINQLNETLQESGIDQIITEKQRQLDLWKEDKQ